MNRDELKRIVKEVVSEAELLLEKDYKELRDDDPIFLKRRERSKKTPGSLYKGLLKNNTLVFETPSHTSPGKMYIQKVRLLDLPALIKQHKGSLSNFDIVKLATEGDVAVYCNDPSFKFWGFEYKAKKEGYGIHKQDKFPKVRNPQLRGSMCKHLDNVMLVLPFNVAMITRDLVQRGAL